jgi:hypothetical protein
MVQTPVHLFIHSRARLRTAFHFCSRTVMKFLISAAWIIRLGPFVQTCFIINISTGPVDINALRRACPNLDIKTFMEPRKCRSEIVCKQRGIVFAYNSVSWKWGLFYIGHMGFNFPDHLGHPAGRNITCKPPVLYSVRNRKRELSRAYILLIFTF